MTFSIHTFELSLTLDSGWFKELKSKAYKRAKGKYLLLPDKDKSHVCIDTYFSHIGINGLRVEYHNEPYKKKIKLIVNPSRLLGGNDLKLWKPVENNISKLLRILSDSIRDYFHDEYDLDDLKLGRVDFTVNIDVGSRKSVSAYIKVLNGMGKVKGYRMKYDKEYIRENHIDRNLSFDLAGISNGIEFTVYDKEAESELKKAKGILRVEVRMTKVKAIRNHTREEVTSEQIRDLAMRSEDIFMNTFTRIVPVGMYYKKSKAVELIENSSFKRKQKEKMLCLLDLIKEKKSLHLAQKTMQGRNMDQIMEWFAKLGVSPVTISKRLDVKSLESLYSYL